MRRRRFICLLLALCLIFVLSLPAPIGAAPSAGSRPRRVNIPYFAGTIDWSQAAIFWFGQNIQGVPSRNYVDVRLAYAPDGLAVRATVIDYYLWYKTDAPPGDDLTQYDAVAIYLDTDHDRLSSPQTDDYYFLVGSRHYPTDDAPNYRRQAKGTGSSWDTTWSSTWLDYSGLQWSCDPGPNSNTCGIDYGWVAGITIPWAQLGRSGLPASDTVWGLGMLLYDRDDQPPAGYVAPDYWPETFNANNPATWSELHFGTASYTPPAAIPRGSVLIRAPNPTDNNVEDSWMGGVGWCNGGHEGHSEDNHGNDAALFVGSEIVPTHFPCYNKSYLRFALSSIPPGKVIMSATLTLHHWGNAGDPGAPNDEDHGHDSYVWLSSVSDPWDEMTIHWNNAPLAQENFDVERIVSLTSFPGWPGVAHTWDATQVTAEAYASSQPLNLALYDSSTMRNTSKYLTASETGLGDGTPNWNIAGRPRLDVVYGDPVGVIQKRVTPVMAHNTDTITYTLTWTGISQTLQLTDTLPVSVSAPSGLSVTQGTPLYDAGAQHIVWAGAPVLGQPVTLTYRVTIETDGPRALSSTAILSSPQAGTTRTATAIVFVDGYQVLLPIVLR